MKEKLIILTNERMNSYTMQVTFDKKQENYLTGFITGPY